MTRGAGLLQAILILVFPKSWGHLLHQQPSAVRYRSLFGSSNSKNSLGPHLHLPLHLHDFITMPRRRPSSTVVMSSSAEGDLPAVQLPLVGGSSSKGGTRIYNGGEKPHDDKAVKLFRKWFTHSDMSFHSFHNNDDENTAADIRMALLVWYRQNRRKLPWRGDAPPYDGSTAGINNNKNKNNKQTVKEKTSQDNKITNFFQPSTKKTNDTTTSTSTSSSKKSNCAADSPSSNTNTNRPIPMSPYGVWVSEIMLQQTRVEAVIPYWIRWMTSFPTVQDLADASEEQVNAHWAGLGFYRRARMLHQGAQLVVREYHGELPGTVEGLLKITGIGPYTASAIASIAFGVCVPVVDGNVCRVLSRLTGIANHIKAPALKDKQGWDLASQLVQAGDASCAGEVNQALMEVGATYCAPSGTGIDPRDPLKDYYYSTRLTKGYLEMLESGDGTLMVDEVSSCACPLCDSSGIPVILEEMQDRIQIGMSTQDAMKIGHSIFPLDPPKTKRREEDLAVAVISNVHDGQTWWLLIRRPDTGLLAGQWEFPSVCVETRQEGQSEPPTPNASKRRQALTQHLDAIMTNGEQGWWTTSDIIKRKPAAPAPLEHIFSHVKHIMWLETISVNEDLSTIQWISADEGRRRRQVRWMRESDMQEVGITSGVKKVIKAVQQSTQENELTTKKRKR